MPELSYASWQNRQESLPTIVLMVWFVLSQARAQVSGHLNRHNGEWRKADHLKRVIVKAIQNPGEREPEFDSQSKVLLQRS